MRAWITENREAPRPTQSAGRCKSSKLLLIPWLTHCWLLVVAKKKQNHSNILLDKSNANVTPIYRLRCVNVNVMSGSIGSPGNIVPLDSIGIEVVQDSKANLGKDFWNHCCYLLFLEPLMLFYYIWNY